MTEPKKFRKVTAKEGSGRFVVSEGRTGCSRTPYAEALFAKPNRRPKHLLIVNLWDSKCGNCGQAADPNEKCHDTVLGYSDPKPGCGIRYVFITSHYRGDGLKERIWAMRPELEWID